MNQKYLKKFKTQVPKALDAVDKAHKEVISLAAAALFVEASITSKLADPSVRLGDILTELEEILKNYIGE